MSTPESFDIEDLLTEAGVAFTVVDRCPHPQCELCADEGLSAAA